MRSIKTNMRQEIVECGTMNHGEKLSSNMWFMARWLDIPASAKSAVAGTRQHDGKQGNENTWKAGDRLQPRRDMVTSMLCRWYFWARHWITIAHACCCTLVSAWPAKCLVIQICKTESTSSSCCPVFGI